MLRKRFPEKPEAVVSVLHSSVPVHLQEVSDVIEKNWQELIRPNKLEVNPGHDPKRQATIVAEPLERGYGMDAR